MLSFGIMGIMMVLVAVASPTAARASGMQDDVDRAVSILEQFQAGPQPTIPGQVLRSARGIAFLTVHKLSPRLRTGQVLSGRSSKGILVARTAAGWSGPFALASGSAGFGGEIEDVLGEFILVINDAAALNALVSGENVYLGASVSLAPGPRRVIVGAAPTASIYYYGKISDPSLEGSLEGVVVSANDYENRDYHGQAVSAQALLSGQAAPPPEAAELRKLLAAY
ncbi:MAG: lipid-binding SYLF domain-containing protein [Syntrophobacteraceae bacterium]|nr:lipid-binding SYLF domain-containing protein [Syntrophobacteraceae bacterium]